ncbi:ABC transporter ATP-binding protein [Ktedonobacter sp. SOSP1-52]|uniref:ATP-binding cassette domain-containing protein n=1 Tax=Ktedonobacter sp. SOSP1-52 TaxID=2778366 RepID=UPI001914DB73|nr:ABC transporter ATP-binding protein [Ktedonobacter sp. SOSP1-52]
MQEHIAAANAPFWRYINHILIDEWSQLLLVVIGLIPAYVAVTLGVLSGTTPLAIQIVVLSAGAAVYLNLAPSATSRNIVAGAAILDKMERLRNILQSSPSGVVLSRSVTAIHQHPACHPPSIVFDEVTFHYPQSNQMILDHLTLDISAGESLALVGLNGSGKSTMMKLLTGLYAPTSGRILIDGQDLSQLDLAEWRARVAVIFQDFIHYPLSARENVTFNGDQTAASFLNPTTARSGIANVIDRLPKGWSTPLTRSRAGGVDLSGGNGSRLPWLGRCTACMKVQVCSCSTNPPLIWTCVQRLKCSGASVLCGVEWGESSSHTGSPPSAMPTALCCSQTGGSLNRERTTN